VDKSASCTGEFPLSALYEACVKCVQNIFCKTRIRLEIEIEIGLEFNQSEERKPISSLMNFALIGQNPVQSQF